MEKGPRQRRRWSLQVVESADSAPGVVTGIALVGGGLVTLTGLFSSFKMGKGLFNLVRGSLGGGKAGAVQKVFVTNAEDGGGDSEGSAPKGKAGKALSLVETGLKAVAAFTGKGAEGSDDEADSKDDKKPGKFDLIATGLKVVSMAKDVASGGDEGDEGGEGGEAGSDELQSGQLEKAGRRSRASGEVLSGHGAGGQ